MLARIEDAWQLGFVVEAIDADHSAVFVPDSPNPHSGSVYFMGKDRLKSIDIPLKDALT